MMYILLPDSINLKSQSLDDHYNTVSVSISGKKPGEKINISGESMVYGITIPDKTKNRDAAIKFVEFLLDREKGMKIMEKMGQQALIPSPTESFDKIPGELRKFALEP